MPAHAVDKISQGLVVGCGNCALGGFQSLRGVGGFLPGLSKFLFLLGDLLGSLLGLLRGVFPYFGEVAFGISNVLGTGFVFATGFPQPVLSVNQLIGIISLSFRQVLPSFGQFLLSVGDVFGLISNRLASIDQALFSVDHNLTLAKETATPGS